MRSVQLLQTGLLLRVDVHDVHSARGLARPVQVLELDAGRDVRGRAPPTSVASEHDDAPPRLGWHHEDREGRDVEQEILLAARALSRREVPILLGPTRRWSIGSPPRGIDAGPHVCVGLDIGLGERLGFKGTIDRSVRD